MAIEQVYPYAGRWEAAPAELDGRTHAEGREVREPGRCEPAPLGHVSGRER